MNNQDFNLFLAIMLSMAIIFGWQHYYERPKTIKAAEAKKIEKTIAKEQKTLESHNEFTRKSEAIRDPSRIKFENAKIDGSINTLGLRFDDIRFKNYKETIHNDSENISLLEPVNTSKPYFAEFGWVSDDKAIRLPNYNSVWTCDKKHFIQNEALTCKWNNNQGLNFFVKISLDDHYMFNIHAQVENHSGANIKLKSYGLIYKTYDYKSANMSIVHEGISGVIDDELREYGYTEVRDKKKITSQNSKIDWLSLNDKYWITAFIPDKERNYDMNAAFFWQKQQPRYQVSFISDEIEIKSGTEFQISHYLFGGAKELSLIDEYESKLKIKLFDRTVDFGWFYIITKPLLNILHFFDDLVGNYGLSIMIVTILVKLSMFGMASKSFKSMKSMRTIQPQIDRLKTIYKDDQVTMNKEIMELYKKHNINPLAGLLPLLIQIPVFFSLYKVLNVSIDMRHAPFYGWIFDLSAPDPSNIFNLFGILAFEPPSYLHIGAWPLLMALTMFIQQKLSPPPSDPVQAQVMSLMPIMFLFMFSSFPSGLLIYWTWNNILSIAQQSYINISNDKSR